MIFKPQKYEIEDKIGVPFISVAEIERILDQTPTPSLEEVEAVVERSLKLNRLSLQEVAILLNSEGKEATEIIFNAAREVKKEIYGDRIVLFAPLYIGNSCINNCLYCGFRASNTEAIRRTLSDDEIREEVRELERAGQKRLILVYGEHPKYDAEYIAHTVRLVYDVSEGEGKINRVNINAAPFSVEGFRTIKEAGIGTFQVFQETYHPDTYRMMHPSGPKSDFNNRLTSMDRAIEAGIDDVGLGALFGVGDWRFEIMGLVRHTNHLEACFNTGPHTLSFPRLQKAHNVDMAMMQPVDDEEFKKIVAILRLAVPYAGLILTAREPQALRDQLLEFGVSQIDAGTNLEIGGYSEKRELQELEREQFELSDTRTLADTMDQLVDAGQIPSFCTACYRKGRTGEHFMEFSTKGFIKNFCTPNALLTFAEYLEEYASPERQQKGWALIEEKQEEIEDGKIKSRLADMLRKIKEGDRDLFF